VLEGRAVDDPLVVFDEIAAGSTAEPVGDPPHPATVDVDDVLLVAAGTELFLALEDQLLTGL